MTILIFLYPILFAAYLTLGFTICYNIITRYDLLCGTNICGVYEENSWIQFFDLCLWPFLLFFHSFSLLVRIYKKIDILKMKNCIHICIDFAFLVPKIVGKYCKVYYEHILNFHIRGL